jgi:hypothetical protein
MLKWRIAYNFLCCGSDQPILLLLDLRDWQPEEHLVWFILDVVDQLDLAPLPGYRGHHLSNHPAGHRPPASSTSHSSLVARGSRAPKDYQRHGGAPIPQRVGKNPSIWS